MSWDARTLAPATLHRFGELPQEVQDEVWRYVLYNENMAKCCGFSLEEELETYDDAEPWIARCALSGNPITLTTRSGKPLYVTDLNTQSRMHELKRFFNYISACRVSRWIGLEWWRDMLEAGETGFDYEVDEWAYADDDDELLQEALEARRPEKMAELRRPVLEVLGELIEDVKTGKSH